MTTHSDSRARRALFGAAAATTAIAATAAARRLPRPTSVTLPDPLLDIIDRRRIAVLPLKGVIGGTLHAVDVTRQLDRVRDDRNIRALVLDIDSPGGSAVESEALYRATKRVAAKKPVVAWIRGTGASGSYFAACGATRILAFPGAIVGSIGVISARPILVDVLRRIGASMEVTKTGPFKDLGAPWREPTDADRAKERQLVEGVFKRFTEAVSSARNLDSRQLKKVTTGEVWLAQEALTLGLVDGLAEEEEAHVAAQELAHLPRKRIVRIQRRRNLAQRLGLPGAGMDSASLLAELDGWLQVPRLKL
jgi:protease IV